MRIMKKNQYGHYSAIWRLFVKGSEARRAFYANLIRFATRREVAERQSMAEQVGEEAPLKINKEDGFKVFGPGTFAEVEEMIRAVEGIVGTADLNDLHLEDRDFILNGLLAEDQLTLDSPFLRFALRPDVIAGIADYLGVVPVLNSVDVWVSKNDAPAEGVPLAKSQYYHCDWADVAQMKIFIYCSDVGEASGPLVVMGADTSKQLRDTINYTFGGKRYRVSDEEVETLIGDKDQHAMVGSAGTVVFADTSRCFHFGSRVKKGAKPRVLVNYQFLTPTGFQFPPGGFKASAPLAHLATADHSLLERMVLGAD